MADDDLLPPDDELLPDDPIEAADPADDDLPPDDAKPAADDEPLDDDPDGQPDTRTTRGQPDPSQRDRRLSRREQFQREVDAAVERRMGQQPRQQPVVDYAAQRAQLDARRRQELDEARLQSPETYADTRDRHLREDYQADINARTQRENDDRDQMRFERLCDRNSIYDSVSGEVEKRVNQLRTSGVPFVQRELIAKVVLGERYAERATRQGNQQRRTAGTENRRQSVRPSANLSGQQPAARRRSNANFADLSVEDMERQLGSIAVKNT